MSIDSSKKKDSTPSTVKGKKEKKKKEYYVDPVLFKEQLTEYYDSDIMTDKLAENIVKIANGLSFSPSFINYSWKSDMIGDALIKMYAALKFKKYKLDKSTSPFGYFTTIAYNAFINRIKKEKKYHNTLKAYKERVYEDIMTDPELSDGYVYVRPNNELEL